jgi:hypothetical protein
MASPSHLAALCIYLAGGLSLAGCLGISAWPRGNLRSQPLPLGPAPSGEGEAAEPWGSLALDELGNLSLDGQPLDVPQAREERWAGVRLADASALPAAWRPRHTAEGGVLVAALERTSPLAFAGLRPFDRIDRLNGEAAGEPAALAARLGALQPGETVSLEVTGPEGQRFVETRATASVHDSTNVYVPFLFEYLASPADGGLALGPWLPAGVERDGIRFGACLFESRRRLRFERAEPESGMERSLSYVERSAWRVLLGLIGRRSTWHLASGRTETRWTLLWAIEWGSAGESSAGEENRQ